MNIHPYHDGSRRGFSLVELLVVIGIIGLLIAILLPALRNAREAAKTVQCKSQLRSLGQALYIYASNYQGYMPGWSGWHVVDGDANGHPDDKPGQGWTEKLANYYTVPTSEVFFCPSFPEEFRINYFMSARWTRMQNPPRRNLKFGEISKSSQFIVSGDCTQPKMYGPDFGTQDRTSDNCDKDDASWEAIVFFGQDGGMNVHRGGNNVLFADGHVDLFRTFDRTRMTYHPREMAAYDDIQPEDAVAPPPGEGGD